MAGAQGFLWRDCKPENILLAGKGTGSSVKLADFGLSIDATEERPVTRAGTLDYMAPEARPQFAAALARDWLVPRCQSPSCACTRAM
jgi:aurora kinase